MKWIDVEDQLPDDGDFVLCSGNHGDDDEFVNEILDVYSDGKINKGDLPYWFNPVLSVQFRKIERNNCWLYPNVFDGGLVDFGDSITHWMPLPAPPK